MKIIGHRGAAGSELENTLASIKASADSGVWATEFDVRKTKDGHLVVFHDADLVRVANSSKRISEIELKELQKIPLMNGSHIPTLAEALDALEDARCIIELKSSGCIDELLKVTAQFPNANFMVASFKADELAELKHRVHDIKTFILERTKPMDVIHTARDLRLDGVGLNHWLLNPLTYKLLRRAKLDVYVYTVDSPVRAKFINLLYPEVMICTNYPDQLMKKLEKKTPKL